MGERPGNLQHKIHLVVQDNMGPQLRVFDIQIERYKMLSYMESTHLGREEYCQSLQSRYLPPAAITAEAHHTRTQTDLFK
jgi:hypothetical protein